MHLFQGPTGRSRDRHCLALSESLRLAAAVKNRTELSANFGTDLPNPTECSGHELLPSVDLVFCFSANFLFR